MICALPPGLHLYRHTGIHRQHLKSSASWAKNSAAAAGVVWHENIVQPADVRYVSTRISVEFLSNRLEINIISKFHFAQVDLQELLSSLGLTQTQHQHAHDRYLSTTLDQDDWQCLLHRQSKQCVLVGGLNTAR